MKFKVASKKLPAKERNALGKRRIFLDAGVFVINLISSSGAGETSLF